MLLTWKIKHQYVVVLTLLKILMFALDVRNIQNKMGKNVYTKVKEMLDNVKEKELTLDQLKGLIMTHIGSVETTIQTALKTMNMTGLIEDMGNYKFKIKK